MSVGEVTHIVVITVGVLAVCWGVGRYAAAVVATRSVVNGIRLDLAMPPAWALDVAEAQFEVARWHPIEGDGSVNRQHVSASYPAVSVEAVPGGAAADGTIWAGGDGCLSGGSEVHIWLSGWTVRAGVVRHASVACAQMRLVSEVLRTADRSYVASS
ncbi:hypothetical protein KEM60_01293 [Austwickia sp. TVS 96-490-7B]|nr:hypothetical protein [Austwickia sp. TVS 96-490-7B]